MTVKKLFALECRRVFSDVCLELVSAPLEGEEATFRYKTANRKELSLQKTKNL